MHDMFDAGYNTSQIGNVVGLPASEVLRYLKRVKPVINSARIAWWSDEAACRDKNIEFFYPSVNGIPAARQKKQGMQLCEMCPVKRQCYDTAVANYEQHGIWGGVDFSRFSYRFDEKTGRVVVRVKEKSGSYKKVS